MEVIANDQRPTRRPFTFSTTNFVVVSALLVAVISHIFASRELRSLKREVKNLRGELGYFEVEDPTKCYVICAPQIEKDTFTFRLYLPPGHNYIWKSSNPLHSTRPVLQTGDLAYSVIINRTSAGMLYFNETGELGGASSIPLVDVSTADPASNQYLMPKPEHYKKLTEIKPGDPIRLLSLRYMNENKPTLYDGFEIWLEEAGKPLKREGEASLHFGELEDGRPFVPTNRSDSDE